MASPRFLLATYFFTIAATFELIRFDDLTNTTFIYFEFMFHSAPGIIRLNGQLASTERVANVYRSGKMPSRQPASRHHLDFIEALNETHYRDEDHHRQVLCTKPEAPSDVRVEVTGETTATMFYRESDLNVEELSGVQIFEENGSSFLPSRTESPASQTLLYQLTAFSKYLFYVQQAFECCCSFDPNLPPQYFSEGFTFYSARVYANAIRTYPRTSELAVENISSTSVTLKFDIQDFDPEVQLILEVNEEEVETFKFGSFTSENRWDRSGLTPGVSYLFKVTVHDTFTDDKSLTSTVPATMLPATPEAEIEISNATGVDVILRIIPPDFGIVDKYEVRIFKNGEDNYVEHELLVDAEKLEILVTLMFYDSIYTLELTSFNSNGEPCVEPFRKVFKSGTPAASTTPKPEDNFPLTGTPAASTTSKPEDELPLTGTPAANATPKPEDEFPLTLVLINTGICSAVIVVAIILSTGLFLCLHNRRVSQDIPEDRLRNTEDNLGFEEHNSQPVEPETPRVRSEDYTEVTFIQDSPRNAEVNLGFEEHYIQPLEPETPYEIPYSNYSGDTHEENKSFTAECYINAMLPETSPSEQARSVTSRSEHYNEQAANVVPKTQNLPTGPNGQIDARVGKVN